MYQAMFKVLPSKTPGLTQSEVRQAVLPNLPENLYPGGSKADWWSKLDPLDLEAKGLLARLATKPLRWHRRLVK